MRKTNVSCALCSNQPSYVCHFCQPSHPVGKLHVWPATVQDDLDIFGRKIGKPMSIARFLLRAIYLPRMGHLFCLGRFRNVSERYISLIMHNQIWIWNMVQPTRPIRANISKVKQSIPSSVTCVPQLWMLWTISFPVIKQMTKPERTRALSWFPRPRRHDRVETASWGPISHDAAVEFAGGNCGYKAGERGLTQNHNSILCTWKNWLFHM